MRLLRVRQTLGRETRRQRRSAAAVERSTFDLAATEWILGRLFCREAGNGPAAIHEAGQPAGSTIM
jgi:hypothetical protein